MRKAKHLFIAATYSIISLSPATAISADELSTSQNNGKDWEHLENRIKTLEKKLLKQNASFKINGFINAALARSDDDSKTENWGGITNKNDFAALSNIGIQLSFSPNYYTQITTQLMSRGEEEWEMEAEWAYIALNPTDSLTFRFGRQKAPLYLLSEYIEVAYANPWIYAPDEVYGITGDNTYDGINLLYTIPSDHWDTTLQAMWGNNKFTHAIVGDLALNDFLTLNVTSRNESTTLRLGYTVLTADVPAVSLPLPDIPAAGISAGDTLNYAAEESDVSYLAAGFIFDNNRWLLMSEIVQLKIGGWFSDTNGAYLMTGYRFGKVMPHFTASKMENKDPGARDAGTITSASTGATLPLPGQAVGGIADTFIAQDQTTYTLGIRYEILPSVSLKAELSHLTDFNDSIGKFSGAAAPTKDNVNIMKLSIDSVF